MADFETIQHVHEGLAELAALKLPPPEKPAHFVRLEETIRGVQPHLHEATLDDKRRIAAALNAVLEKFSASLVVVGTGGVANKVFASDEGRAGALKLRLSLGTTRSLAAVEIEVVQSLPNRRQR